MRLLLPVLLLAAAGCTALDHEEGLDHDQAMTDSAPSVHYLEFVTPDVDATCATYERALGVTFGEPVAELGGARTAPLANGGMLGVRAPMHAAETPITRAYLLVPDIEASTAAAEESGAMIAHPPLELPGIGTFSIFIQGENQHALWQR